MFARRQGNEAHHTICQLVLVDGVIPTYAGEMELVEGCSLLLDHLAMTGCFFRRALKTTQGQAGAES